MGRFWLVHGCAWSVWGDAGWYMVILGQYRALLVVFLVVLIDIGWYWVSMEQNWLIHDGTGSVWGDTGWYLVVLGQYNLILMGIKWYWVCKMLVPVYIEKAEIWSGVTNP